MISFYSQIINQVVVEQNSLAKIFYKAIVRVLLVILHDWPDFLAKYANDFIEIIPNKYI